MADLTVLINEKITLDGNDRGVFTSQIITGINNIDNRILNIPTGSYTGLFWFEPDNLDAAIFTTSSFKYGRVTNRSTVDVQLAVYSKNPTVPTDYYPIITTLTPGNSFFISSTASTGSITPTNFTALNDYIQQILVSPSGSSATIEYFIATT